MEASPKPHLHLVDHNGVATEVCEHCAAKDQAIARLTRSYEGTIRQLRLELDDKRADDKLQEPGIVAVVEDWCRHAETSGWWKAATVTEPRCDATRAALNHGRTPSYLMTVNVGSFVGAATERNNPRFKRAFLEPSTIYGKHMDAHFQTAIDPKNERVREIFETPKVLRDRWLEVLDLADVCDCCGHARLDHQKEALTVDNRLTFGGCLVHGCAGCDGFLKDWFRDERVARWMETQG